MLLEDDISLVDGLEYALTKEGFAVTVVRTVQEALNCYKEHSFDLCILDLTLPDGSGFQVCEKIRENSTVPVIFLTASEEEANVVRGLDMGGDDYVTKPFRLKELISRIRALLRRSMARTQSMDSNKKNIEEETVLRSGAVHVELLRGSAYLGNTLLELTAMEYKLLCLFLQNKNVLLSRETILSKLWDCNGEFVDDNTLSVYIKRLRSKLEKDEEAVKKLRTICGMGYQWVD